MKDFFNKHVVYLGFLFVLTLTIILWAIPQTEVNHILAYAIFGGFCGYSILKLYVSKLKNKINKKK